MMQAWQSVCPHSPGARDTIACNRVRVPMRLDGDQVQVRVRAAALNPIDVYRLEEGPFPHTIGYDFAGTVERLPDARRECSWERGDHVFGCVHPSGRSFDDSGSLQEYVVVNVGQCTRMPDNLSFTEAASTALVGTTVVQAFDAGRLHRGGDILITGGAGGVGSIAIQIAKAVYEADTVRVTVHTEAQAEFCRRLGADHVTILHSDVPMQALPSSVTCVLDCTHEGRQLATMAKGIPIVSITSSGAGVTSIAARTGRRSELERLLPALESGRVRPVIDRVFKFGDVPAAINHLSYGHPMGKVVITFEQE
ncbi:hypothetical protein PBRA_000224 [Plasmodiophora brassicae]|uniref:Enoyl reductase (ER) domain-containing protein n=1 Tax=Plasmodiophora brassicae TaxID=37360 RepID=A0A0G4IGY0_PLABS|nr:hypothetical protein PBRA_000224 [Plasmodiophora brassicae]